jgi:hypothetical protein
VNPEFELMYNTIDSYTNWDITHSNHYHLFILLHISAPSTYYKGTQHNQNTDTIGWEMQEW